MNQLHINLEQKTPEKYFVNLTIDEELLKEIEATEGYSCIYLKKKKSKHNVKQY